MASMLLVPAPRVQDVRSDPPRNRRLFIVDPPPYRSSTPPPILPHVGGREGCYACGAALLIDPPILRGARYARDRRHVNSHPPRCEGGSAGLDTPTVRR